MLVADKAKKKKGYKQVYVEPLQFGSVRKPKQFTLTATAIGMIEETSAELETSSASVIECLIRGGGLDYANPPDASSWSVKEFYGEPKNFRPTYGLTAEASEILSAIAKSKDSNRSAILESAIRDGGLDKAREYYLSILQLSN